MKKRMFFKQVSIATALTALALLAIFLVNAGTAQEEKEPCPRPYIKAIFKRTGKPGDQVIIRGRRFGTEKGVVYFRPEAKAEVVKWTNSRIWAIVPQTASTGHVTVSTPCGAVSNEQYFKVTE